MYSNAVSYRLKTSPRRLFANSAARLPRNSLPFLPTTSSRCAIPSFQLVYAMLKTLSSTSTFCAAKYDPTPGAGAAIAGLPAYSSLPSRICSNRGRTNEYAPAFSGSS